MDSRDQSTNSSMANDGHSKEETDGQDSVRRIPAVRIASLRRKKEGARKRVATRSRDLKALQTKLNNKSLRLSLSERRDIKHSILSIELELEQARDELRVNDAALNEALKHNNQLKKRKVIDHRAERRLKSRVPSFTDDVRSSIHTELVGATIGTGSTDPIEGIVLSNDVDKFDTVLSDLLKENKPELWKEMNRFESVKKAVFRNIWNEYERKDIVLTSASDANTPNRGGTQ